MKKKTLALTLSLIMLFACFSPAIAGAADEFTPIYAWDDSMWQNAFSWSDETWMAYMEYEQSLVFDGDYSFYIKLNEAQLSWNGKQFDVYYKADELFWISENSKRILDQKLKLGVPYPYGCNIMLNSDFIEFEGSAPIVLDGTMMAPVSLLEKMGASLDLSADGLSASGKLENISFSFSADYAIMTINFYGEEVPVYLDTSPAIYNGGLFFPLRSVVFALGYDVLWDSDYNTAIILNRKAIIAKINEDFNVYNKLFKTIPSSQTSENYSGSFSASVEGTLYGDGSNSTDAKASLKGEFILGKAASSLDMRLFIDIDDFIPIVKDILYIDESELRDVISRWNGSDHSFIYDTENSEVFIKSQFLREEFESIPKDSWVRISQPDMEYFSDIFLPTHITSASDDYLITVGELLYDSAYPTYWFLESIKTYDNIITTAEIAALIIGDKTFNVNSQGSTTQYVSELNTDSLMKMLVSFLAETDLDYSSDIMYDLGLIYGSMPDFSLRIAITERGGSVTDLNAALRLKASGIFPFETTANVRATQTEFVASAEIKGQYLGKLSLKSDFKIHPTNEKAKFPPTGNIIDYSDLFDYSFDYDYSQDSWLP